MYEHWITIYARDCKIISGYLRKQSNKEDHEIHKKRKEGNIKKSNSETLIVNRTKTSLGRKIYEEYNPGKL